ncbi:MAG TPA: DUF6526 family protein [Vicinamibacterales bacterium]|nr:DUF6526 family protein [Vicinamibacterales bacterium]
MSEPQQSFQNHVRIVPAYHYLVFGAFSINLMLAIKALWDTPTLTAGSDVLTAVALIVLALYARVFPLAAQDRVIRLEMRQRLKETLPAALQGRIDDFTRGQLVALRFASDEELGELAEKVLTGNIQDRKAIKKMIRSWRSDHLRV